MKRIFLILLSINLFTFALAQSLTVKGKVSSTDGELLPGVNVKVKNATIGTITDFDGNYQLKVDKGDILVFTYVGFKRHELKVGNQTSWNVELTPDQTDLDEVVVVAYGKAKRITLTGAVSGIQAREIRNVPTSSLQNALTGKLPGFFSQQSSGQPGKDASDFFIRGVSSLNADGNKPLIIVDEPTSALDAGSTDKVLAFFRNQAEKGTAILAVSHDRTFAYGCNQLITL